MTLKFGTSGVRGLETELTDTECARFGRAFIGHYRTLAKPGSRPACIIAGDLRRSTPRILNAIARGIEAEDFAVLDAGLIPTPALAYECASRSLPGIMVTGSHIPADRNGIKFYFPWGEILKEDESPILENHRRIETTPSTFAATPTSPSSPRERIPAETRFVERYSNFFGANPLAGMKIVFYEHSSAARDCFPRILENLGASVIRVQRSNEFIPVDTEALQNIQSLGRLVFDHSADALVSTDGDGDRPLLVDQLGKVVRGDQIGVLAAMALRADSVTTPVSSSTAVDACQAFPEVRRCKIGSPYVVAAMQEAAQLGHKRIIGFEANGGFILGSDIPSQSGSVTLSALPTRDSVLPVLLVLSRARKQQQTLSDLVATLPPRFTESGLIRDFALERSRKVLERLLKEGTDWLNSVWGTRIGRVREIDQTDGVRVQFESDEILHFRPSGNAPEFRVYSEAKSESRAQELNQWAVKWVGEIGIT